MPLVRTVVEDRWEIAYFQDQESEAENSALEQLEGDLSALPLNHREVDPDACQGLQKWDAVISTEVVTFGKASVVS